MMFFNSVQTAIETMAKLRPGARAVMGPGLDISYEQLVQDVEVASRFIASHGVLPGERALILMLPTYMHTVFILALDRLGVTSMSNSFVGNDVLSQQWSTDSEFDYVFACSAPISDHGVKWIEVPPDSAPSALFPPDAAGPGVISNDDPDCLVRLIRSSGTTGTAKVIGLSRATVMKRLMAHHMMVEGAGTNRHLLTMPPGTIAGYGFLLMVLCRGATLVVMAPGADIGGQIDGYQASHLLLTPIALRQIVLSGARSGRTHDSVKMVTTGGAPFEVELMDMARAVLGPNIWNGYTSTEAGSVARGHISQLAKDPRMIGPVLPFVHAEIVDTDDAPLPTGEIGRVRVSSELMVDHYENVDDVEGVFRDGFVYTGDLGSLDDRGYLTIVGRADGVINQRGVKFLPEEVERQIMSLPAVAAAAVFQLRIGSQQQLKVCAAIELAEGMTEEGVVEQLHNMLGARAPQMVKFLESLPRNAMGKVVRAELPALMHKA